MLKAYLGMSWRPCREPAPGGARPEAAYGSSQVLFGIDLRLKPVARRPAGPQWHGQEHALRCCGWLAPTQGRIRFAGQDVTGWSADRIAQLGLGPGARGAAVLLNLSVHEHLAAFASTRHGSAWTPERVFVLFPSGGAPAAPGRPASGGEQQMLAIGRALVTNPSC